MNTDYEYYAPDLAQVSNIITKETAYDHDTKPRPSRSSKNPCIGNFANSARLQVLGVYSQHVGNELLAYLQVLCKCQSRHLFPTFISYKISGISWHVRSTSILFQDPILYKLDTLCQVLKNPGITLKMFFDCCSYLFTDSRDTTYDAIYIKQRVLQLFLSLEVDIIASQATAQRALNNFFHLFSTQLQSQDLWPRDNTSSLFSFLSFFLLMIVLLLTTISTNDKRR